MNILPELKEITAFRPLGAHGWNHKRNIDGIVTYSTKADNTCNTYCQLYRSGIVETVAVLEEEGEYGGNIPSEWYEREIIHAASTYTNNLLQSSITLPFYIFVSLINMQNFKLGVSSYTTFATSHTLGRERATFPEAVIEDMENDLYQQLRPTFDIIWNAFGYERSFNYDDEGNWNK